MTIRTNQRAYREQMSAEENAQFVAQGGTNRSDSAVETYLQDPARLSSGRGLLKPIGSAAAVPNGVGNPLIEVSDIQRRRRG